MTVSTLFGQATPTGLNSGSGNAGTNGLHFTVSAACTLEGIWHYSPSTSTQLPTEIGLYTTQSAPTSGTLVHSETASWSGAAGSGWVYAAFASPPSLSSGVNYMAANWRNDAVNEWFVYYDVTWPVTSGILTAPADEGTAAASQGWYDTGTPTAMTFPASQVAGVNYGMDVQVATSSPSPSPFAGPVRAVPPPGAPRARAGSGKGSPGAPREPSPPPFAPPRAARKGAQSARRGASAFSPGAPREPRPSPFAAPGKGAKGQAAARKGTSGGSAGAPRVPVPSPFRQPGAAVHGRPAAGRGSSEGSPGAPYAAPAVPAPFTLPSAAVPAHPSAARGSSRGSAGAPYVHVTPGAPAPFTQPGSAAPPHPAARRGSSASSPGAPRQPRPAPFAQPGKAVKGTPPRRPGTSRGSAGAPRAYVPVVPAPFTLPSSPPPPHPAARRGSAAGSAGAPWSRPLPAAPFTAPSAAVRPHPAAGTGRGRGQAGAKWEEAPAPPGAILDTTGAPVLDTAGYNVLDTGTAAPADAVLDESGAPVLDEAGAFVLDETGTLPSGSSRAVKGAQSARKGAAKGSPGAPYTYVPVVPAPFRAPRKAAPVHPAARKGTASSSPGAPYVYVPVIPAPFTLPSAAVAPHPSADRGSSRGSAGAPYVYVPPPETWDVLGESGAVVLDEAGADVEDESAPYPVAGTLTWTAARAGMPHDAGAINYPDQAAQFLLVHGVKPVYPGNRVWGNAVPSPSVTGAFTWLDSATAAWLPDADVSQPFTLPAGTTATGRVQVPVLVSGAGADLQATLCPDNGSGSPNLQNPLAAATIPASHVTAVAAGGSLAAATAPFANARWNTAYLGPASSGPWTPPAVSGSGAGTYASPVTSGNFTALIGGAAPGGAATGYTAVVSYQGNSVSGGATQPPLPQPAFLASAAITADSVVVAGGKATAYLGNAWSASWSPGTGTIGAWSAQQSLPSPSVYGAMTAWGTQVYLIGGTPDGTAASATAQVLTASAQSGQVTAWTPCPPLPAPLSQAYAAVIGNWLVVAGGRDTSGNAVASTWYAAIGTGGTLSGWAQGPDLPQPCYAYGPGWNTAVTDSALAIVSGPVSSAGTFSPYTQVLPVGPGGPADAWQVQDWTGSGEGAFACAAYPAGPGGSWQVFNLRSGGYDAGTLTTAALLSVPLPASGLTPGATYHVVLHQSGGSLGDSLALGAVASGGTPLLSAPRGSGGPWTPGSGQQVSLTVSDQTPGGAAVHLVGDSGAQLVTLVRQPSTGLLTGIMEAVQFPAGSPEAVLATVTEVTWTGGLPSGLVSLA